MGLRRTAARAATAAAPTRLVWPALVVGSGLAVGLALVVLAATAAARSPRTALLPPANPQYSLAVGEYLPISCSGVHDYGEACTRESLGMINAGRRHEGLGPVLLPSNWVRLTIAQQLFVLTELERTARGLSADSALEARWNAVAVAGAEAGHDPTGGDGSAALWAGGEPNSIVVMADWVYEDGRFANGFTENLSCSASDESGCWQHRDILLHHGTSGSCGSRCAVGAGYSPYGYRQAVDTGSDSYAEVFARTDDGAQTFSWAAERQLLPACEQSGNSCPWAGSPIETANGIVTVSGSGTGSGSTSGSGGSTSGSGGVSTAARPWFSVGVSKHIIGTGHVTLRIHVGARLLGVRVLARDGVRRVRLHVRRRSRHWYRVTGRLSPGRWTVTIRYRGRRRGRVARATSKLRLSVPATA